MPKTAKIIIAVVIVVIIAIMQIMQLKTRGFYHEERNDVKKQMLNEIKLILLLILALVLLF